MPKYDVLPYYLTQTPWNLEFDKFFPDSEGQWDHASVKDAMRKQALMITMQSMKGKQIKESVRKSAEFVLSKFVQNEASTQVHVTLTLADILESKRKAGLPPELKFMQKEIEAATNGKCDIPSSEVKTETVTIDAVHGDKNCHSPDEK